jgi:hypothetical protein
MANAYYNINTAKVFLMIIIWVFLTLIIYSLVLLIDDNNYETTFNGTVLGLSVAGIFMTSMLYQQSTCSFH